MADSVGIGFPTSGIQKGHTFFDLDEQSEWVYLGGDPKSVASWRLKSGVFNNDPDTSAWGLSQAGASWFNTALGLPRFWTGSAVASTGSNSGGSGSTAAGFDYKTMSVIQDDFMINDVDTALGLLRWQLTGTGGTLNVESGAVGHPGLVILQVGTTILDTFIYSGGGTLAPAIYALDDIDVTVILKLADADTDFILRAGLSESPTFDIVQGIFVEKGGAVGAPWVARFRAVDGDITLSSGIPHDTEWHSFRMTKVGNVATFYVDGVQVATQVFTLDFNTAVAPVITGQAQAAFGFNHAVTVDYFETIVTLQTPRL
jgi:hypothetical protein